MSEKKVKADPLVEHLIDTDYLTLYQSPSDESAIIPFFRQPLFREEDTQNPCFTYSWWREKQDMLISYITECNEYEVTTDQTTLHRVKLQELKALCKKHVEFWNLEVSK